MNAVDIICKKRDGKELSEAEIEFGKTSDGKIILSDEISPDTCRLWDVKTRIH